MATGPLPADAGVSLPPKFTRLAGEALWSAVLDRYQLEQHELLILREIVRCVDDLDRLANIAGRQGAITAGGGIHPAIAEARQMRITLATLIGALRLPEEDDREQVQLRRPRRYAAVRSIDSPAPPTQSVRAVVRNEGPPTSRGRLVALGDTPASPRGQNPRGSIGSAGTPASPAGRKYNAAPSRSSQVTVPELLARMRNESP